HISSSSLMCADYMGGELTGAVLSGLNLTGAKLRDIKFEGVRLDDSWADWIHLSEDDDHEDRAALEEVFVGIIGRPLAQILVQGRVGDDVCARILAHRCRFQVTDPN